MATIPGSGARRVKVLRYARTHPKTQWQRPNSAFESGSTGCSATDVQFILGLHGHHVTLQAIANAVGYPDPFQRLFHVGLYDHQVVQALAHWGVRYKYVTGLSEWELMGIAVRKGPVLVAYTYGWHPQRRGAVYFGLHANGKPNGYAQALGEGGKDQLSGFEHGRHMAIILSKRHRKGTPRNAAKVWMWDSNHGSLVRPHIPDYDVVTPAQLGALVRSDSKRVALVPVDVL